MKYWVVSPNVKNDGDVEEWLGSIRNTHRVFMGWLPDSPKGKTFATDVEIGDRIVIAHGANKNKVTYVCGVVNSEAKTEHLKGTPDQAQNRLLSPITFVEDWEDADFHWKGSTFGNANQITAIYRLRPDENEKDAQIAEQIEALLREKKMKLAIKRYADTLKAHKQIILSGAPGTGKTYLAKHIAAHLATEDRTKLVQFHPAYNYDDFVRGIVPGTTESGGIEYKVRDRPLIEMANLARNSDEDYVLIIDEINRANLPAVLGELIYALEYRGEPVQGLYRSDDGSHELVIPQNLYIIGTMNTADRSVGHIDYAIRRRFAFVGIKSDREVIETYYSNNPSLRDAALTLYDGIKEKFMARHNVAADFDHDDIMIGHSYFLADGDGRRKLEHKLEYQIKPLLREYVKDGVILNVSDPEQEIDALRL